uniref:C3H1-type domain-containing protein n=2 Tax=Oryza brachyantha TaxID=4533 RepID=J3MNX2_ORYBR
MCSAGARCPRRICFFAHGAAELRDDPNSIASAILTPLLPLPPPRPPLTTTTTLPPILKRADHPTVSAAHDHHLDVLEEAMRTRLHLYSSNAAAAAATTPAANGEGSSVGRRCSCSRCVEEEESLLTGYPHYDLIMDLVNN